jgi:hypothetical protein
MPGIKRQTAIATINKLSHIITTVWTADPENATILRFSEVTIERIICGGRDRFPVRSRKTFAGSKTSTSMFTSALDQGGIPDE